VFGPLRDRVRQVLAGHTLEGLVVLESVEMAEQVVERAVLEQHENHVVHRVRAVMAHRVFPLSMTMPGWCQGLDAGGSREAAWILAQRAGAYRLHARHAREEQRMAVGDGVG
jgi:hypothetical protein